MDTAKLRNRQFEYTRQRGTSPQFPINMGNIPDESIETLSSLCALEHFGYANRDLLMTGLFTFKKLTSVTPPIH